jgi:hypothetical protein
VRLSVVCHFWVKDLQPTLISEDEAEDESRSG